MRVFCLCVYSFLICWFFFVSLELILLSLARLCASFWAPWAPKGLSLASLGLPFGSLGSPWSHLGHLGLPRGAWTDFGRKWTSNSEQMALKYATCAQKVTSRNSAPAAPAAPAAGYPRKVEQEPQLPTPLHSRRGLG